MIRKNRVLLSVFITAAVIAAHMTSFAEEPHTPAEEEYMRKQAARYYVSEDLLKEYADPETGEVDWNTVPTELKQSSVKRESVSEPAQSQADRAAEMAAELERRERIRSIRSHRAEAAVNWGISAVSIPEVVVQSVEGTIWGPSKSFNPPAKMAYKVLSKGSEIQIALLSDRVDLPDGVVGQITRPVYDSRGEEIFPQASQIFGQYSHYDQAIVWQHVTIDSRAVKLENPEEMRTMISLTERTEPGYKLSVRIQNTIFIKIPIL